jgi:hypothetical protein
MDSKPMLYVLNTLWPQWECMHWRLGSDLLAEFAGLCLLAKHTVQQHPVQSAIDWLAS